MAVTRINNNQITTAVSGNAYLGINAASKLQNYSITSNKIANSLVYGSDLTVSGNLVVNGTTTTIDTVNTLIQDPLITLADGQTSGTPTVDIGLIGLRGNQLSSFIGWKESSSAFVTALSNTTVSNTTANLTQYANLITGNLSVVGNVIGNISFSGNISAGNLLTSGLVSATGNVIGGNVSTVGNVTGGNVLTAGIVSSTGNAVAGNVLTAGLISATSNITGGNLLYGTGIVSGTGNIYGANLIVSNIESVAGNITGGNLITGGQVSATANIAGGNILTGGLISATGTITSSANIIGGNVTTVGLVSATGNVIGGNVTTAGLISATGTITSAANIIGGNVTTVGLVSATGNVIGGNVTTVGLISATGGITSASTVQGLTVSATGNVIGGNVTTAGLISATGNLTAGNISTAGNVSAANVNTSSIVGTGVTITSTGALNLAPTGNITANSKNITGVADPVNNQDAATKAYVDSVAQGLDVKASVFAATTGNLATATGGTITYNNGNAGVGATLTTTGTFLLIDGANVQTVGSRILVKNEGNAALNGIYTYANTTTIVRSTDFDNEGANGQIPGAFTFVETGTVNDNTGWVCTTNNPVVMGTTAITFQQFSGAGTYTANTAAGISLTGTVFSALVDNNTTAFDGGGNIIVKAGANLTTPNIGAATGTSLSVTGAVNAGTTISATGNITGGNILYGAGIVSGTGNIYGANLIVSNIESVAGNISAGNILTGGLISAAGNINTSANINQTGTGNINGYNGYFSNNLTVIGTFQSTGNIIANVSGIFYGNSVTGNGALYAGVPGYTVLGSNVVAQFAGNANSYSQINFQNINSGTLASTDFIATANNGTDTTFYLDMGINGNTFNDTVNYPGFGPNDSYVHNHGGNLILNPETTGKAINFMVGGTANANVIGYVNASGLFVTGVISATGNVTGGNILTAGIISSTGNAVHGNVSAVGNVNAGGNIIVTGYANIGQGMQAVGAYTGPNTDGITVDYTTGTGRISVGPNDNIVFYTGNVGNTPVANIGTNRITMNSSLNSGIDFAVNGGTANLFYVNSTTNTASFGSNVQATNALVAFNAATSILLPSGNTVQRPSNASSSTGMIRFNTTLNSLEIFNNTAWQTVGSTTFTVIADEQFNGDGATVAFTLASTQTTNSCIVSINGVVQIPVSAYSVAGTFPTCVLTFTEAPAVGDLIDVREITTTTTVTSLSNNSGNATIAGDTTASGFLVTGNLIPASNVTNTLGNATNAWKSLYVAGNTIYLGGLQLQSAVGNVFNVTTDGSTPATISATFSTTGNVVAGNIVNSGANGTGNIGSATTYFNTVFAKATSAQYADLAEKYAADAEYAPGTVVSFGGDKEVTKSTKDGDRAVAGVISTNPSYIMNAGLDAEHVAVVAFTGRVPTSVTGTVVKGDLMVSNGDGTARAEADPKAGAIIGKALENFNGETGVIEVVIGRF